MSQKNETLIVDEDFLLYGSENKDLMLEYWIDKQIFAVTKSGKRMFYIVNSITDFAVGINENDIENTPAIKSFFTNAVNLYLNPPMKQAIAQ